MFDTTACAGGARFGVRWTGGCPSGGHTYGGLGGTHYHGSWNIDFEAAPMTGYVRLDSLIALWVRRKVWNSMEKYGNVALVALRDDGASGSASHHTCTHRDVLARARHYAYAPGTNHVRDQMFRQA